MRVRHEQEMGGPEGSATRLKEGTEEYKKLQAAQDAEGDRPRREVSPRGRGPPSAITRSSCATPKRRPLPTARRDRKREMERIAEGYADDLRKFKDDAVEKGRIKDEITAKQKALAVQQSEERRQERAGIIEQALRAPGVGGQFADEARRLELEETGAQAPARSTRKWRRPVDKMDAAERAEMAAQQNWKPSEVASRKGAWDAGRPSGYDRFMPGQTPEAKALGEYLDEEL